MNGVALIMDSLLIVKSRQVIKDAQNVLIFAAVGEIGVTIILWMFWILEDMKLKRCNNRGNIALYFLLRDMSQTQVI